MFKMDSHWSFEHIKPKLWAKEGPGVKLAIWLPTTKSWESTSSWRLQMECDRAFESSRGKLQLWFRPHSNQRSEPGVVSVQNSGSPTQDSFGTATWESWEKKPFRFGSHGVTQRILYGRKWWLPLNPGRGESSVSKCPWLVPTPKGVLECD